MAGYSGTPLPKKLGLKPGQRVFVSGPAPPGFLEEVDDVTWLRQARAPVDLAVVFTTTETDYRKRLTSMLKVLAADGSLWIAWPKKSSGVTTDLTEDVIRNVAVGETDLVDNKVCAIDDTWSGLRLVVRLTARAGWPVQGWSHRQAR
ncbi:MAG: hypothetical protein V7636_2583 [Actinomycetota bacterium]|jgi:hypothetical protein